MQATLTCHVTRKLLNSTLELLRPLQFHPSIPTGGRRGLTEAEAKMTMKDPGGMDVANAEKD